jgi:endoglucanase
MKTITVIIGCLVFCVIDLPAADGKAQTATPTVAAIKVDQVGYLSESDKIALYASANPASTFAVKRADTGEEVLTGTFGPSALDRDTGDHVQQADFSRLTKPGTYYVDVPGVGRSWRFTIAPDVFDRTYYLAMRGFYSQRCGTAVDMGSEFPAYKHPACHLHGKFHSSSGKRGVRDNVGGWHDAGDYGRYTVNSGITNGTLLWAWEFFPDTLKNRKLNIPETGNGTPDILNEVRWNIEWMLRMQDDDGGAWHKQTSEHFASFVSPDGDNLTSEVIGTGSVPYKSTCATADLAAVAAIAARVFAPFDRAFAGRTLAAARKAWEWTQIHPDVTFKNPPGVITGEYGDKDCSDERLWAAAELWRTTGDAVYQNYFLAHYAQFLPFLLSATPDSWAQLSPMALWTYALANREGRDGAAVAAIRKASVDAGRKIVRRTRANGYRVSLETKDYVWGSNGLAAQYGMQLLITNALAPDPAFRETAIDNLHYLLGRNSFSLSWVTQVGENPFRHPHHRPSVASGSLEPWPGLLSGGPNVNRQDDVLRKLPNLPPAKIYCDDKESYASNEIAINWQAPLVFLLVGELQQGNK